MNPAILFAIAAHNGADVEAIIVAVGGIQKALALLPHVVAISQTVQAEMAKPQPNSPGVHAGGASGG